MPESNLDIAKKDPHIATIGALNTVYDYLLNRLKYDLSVSSKSNSTALTVTGKSYDNSDEPLADSALSVIGSIYSTGNMTANKVFHAVWNDISDAIEVQDDCDVEPGKCYYFDGEKYYQTIHYCQKAIIGIHSDTAGDILGRKGKHKELDIAIGGFVLAYVDKEYSPGTILTSSVDGYLTEMSREDAVNYPERLVGTYWKPEKEEFWGPEESKIKVNGRHWIKI